MVYDTLTLFGQYTVSRVVSLSTSVKSFKGIKRVKVLLQQH